MARFVLSNAREVPGEERGGDLAGVLVLLLVVAVGGLAGCRALDRERYSLVIRKPAHRYQELSALQKEELERYEATRVSSRVGFRDSLAYEPFRPFAYCLRHDSYHLPESFVACVVAPAEYPAAIGGDMGVILVKGLGDALARAGRAAGAAAVWVWESVFPPAPERPVRPPSERGRTPAGEDPG